ncbi:MAG: hypothetical protein ACD_43C00262G0003 [uncultured bacterium]|nr:MAG: hypothetical protein ACD_43C00262G0003 [uncultured bacterium]
MVAIQRWRSYTNGNLPELFRFRLFEEFTELEHGISTRHSEKKLKPTAHVQAAQPHGNRFAVITAAQSPWIVPEVDALLTDQSDICLRIGTSDCVPLIVYDPIIKRGGVIHAGTKGTTQQILMNVLKKFKAQNVWLGIGPAVGHECYNGIDLQHENILQAKAGGVPLQQIEVMRWCTRCQSDTFFSHRAGDRENFGTYFRLVKS